MCQVCFTCTGVGTTPALNVLTAVGRRIFRSILQSCPILPHLYALRFPPLVQRHVPPWACKTYRTNVHFFSCCCTGSIPSCQGFLHSVFLQKVPTAPLSVRAGYLVRWSAYKSGCQTLAVTPTPCWQTCCHHVVPRRRPLLPLCSLRRYWCVCDQML